MKKSFWKSYFSALKSAFLQNVLFSIILLVVVVTSPVGYFFMAWYAEEVPATLIVHDPVAYPHTYKQKVEYNYYATFYFPEIKANKTISVAERTHFHAKAGDIYLFKRGDKLQTGQDTVFMFLAIVQCVIAVMSLGGLIVNFLIHVNEHFSIRKPEPYDIYR
jgi:hypothetical protein